MNEDSNLRPQLITAGVVFLAVVGLGYLFRDFLKETVLVAIEYTFWLGDYFVKLFGQRMLWVLALVLTLGLAVQLSQVLFSLPKERREPINPIKAPDIGRIAFWQQPIYWYRKVSNGGNYFLLAFPKLVIDTLAYHERKDPAVIREMVINGELPVPEEVRRIVSMEALSPSPAQESKPFEGLRKLSKKLLGRSSWPESDSDSRLEIVAAYLEDLLEDENESKR
jgi:hypothetical protein